jgi:hypothetical protein
MAQKTAKATFHAAEGIWGSLLHLEGSFPDTEFWVAPSKHLAIRHQYHKLVDFGTEHFACI